MSLLILKRIRKGTAIALIGIQASTSEFDCKQIQNR